MEQVGLASSYEKTYLSEEEIAPSMSSWFFFLLLAIVQLQAKTHNAGKYKSMCTGISLLKSNKVRLSWIPPVMENGEIPTYRVFYFHDSALSMTLTSKNKLEIPVNENDTMIRVIVRTVTKSEVWIGEYNKDPNECKFNSKRSNDCIFCVTLSFKICPIIQLYFFDRNVTEVFQHQIPDPDSEDLLAPTDVALLPAERGTVALTWKPPFAEQDEIMGYQILYSYVFLFLGPNTPSYVTLRKVNATAMIIWQPPKNMNRDTLLYSIVYNFDNKKILKYKMTMEKSYSIEIPQNAQVMKAAVGVISNEAPGSRGVQIFTAYSPFKYLNLIGKTLPQSSGKVVS
ncbi:unnamed protein product [Rodentolepis nana]|uniref:Fibronectin type-III domain-containing protein n=1 Tax=Rodentolepis nana TaxID=102285 RepID=A0A0R3TR72_RODNA|nr:unnamed protein product [Rodentolepis nana]